jgi:TM2 domain-containing membrane protein YozV
MTIIISIILSVLASCIVVLSYMKKIDKIFDEIMIEYRENIKEATIDTINNWLDSRSK